MSDKKKAVNAAENEKVLTKYDRKMQKRKEEAEKAKKEQLKSNVIGIVFLVALAAFILSFPIRSYLGINGTYIKIGDVKISRVEFDYARSVVRNSYINEYGSFMNMYGITDMTTLDAQPYNDELTFGDYFEKLAVESLVENQGLRKKAAEEGFTYDVTSDVEDMKKILEGVAEQSGTSLRNYVKQAYGSLATWNRLKPCFEDSMYLEAYAKKITEQMEPSAEELQTEYEENTWRYDYVDYHITMVDAVLPDTAPDGEAELDENGEEIPYVPTEEDIAAAMKEAKAKAEEAVKTVAESGNLFAGARYMEIYSLLADYLYDENRKAGDTTIIEDAEYNRYLVVSFDDRYRDEDVTHDIRGIISDTVNAQTILDEWKNGAATEESFIELVEKYDDRGGIATDGLYSGLVAAGEDAEIQEWLSEEGRKNGDATAFTTAEGVNYVLYYLNPNTPVWELEVSSILLEEKMDAFLEEATQGIEVKDSKGVLKYLKVEAQASEASEAVEQDAAE